MPTIIRVEHTKDKPYVLVSRQMIKDLSMDMQSKGFLVFLLSKPDNWKVRPKQLATEIKESAATVYRILNKLIKAGYVHRELIRAQLSNGQFKTASIYCVFEEKDERQEWIDLGRFLYERNRKAGSQI